MTLVKYSYFEKYSDIEETLLLLTEVLDKILRHAFIKFNQRK